jgi:hypothetical protein
VRLITVPLLLLATPLFAGLPKGVEIQPGIYSNEEQVYFDGEAKRPVPPKLMIKIERGAAGLRVAKVDAFGKAQEGAVDLRLLARSQVGGGLRYTPANGPVLDLRRARPVTCWVAVRKDKPKADGSEDWYFQSGVKLHDQGGRAMVGGGESGAQPVIIRIRNVTWDQGSTNAPVITLYAHKPENPDHAEAYAWAAPESARVGINLRWMQSGCSLDGVGTKSTTTFKG